MAYHDKDPGMEYVISYPSSVQLLPQTMR